MDFIKIKNTSLQKTLVKKMNMQAQTVREIAKHIKLRSICRIHFFKSYY